MDLTDAVLEKFKFQWKTIKKAFIDLNKEKTGAIMPKELKNYLKHWGLYLTDSQFEEIFKRLDKDQDGKITYKDFQQSIGYEILPPEQLYFRQDVKRVPKPDKCQEEGCWQQPHGYREFCQMHLKIFANKATRLMTEISDKLRANKFRHFLANIKNHAEKDDPDLITLEKLVKILKTVYSVNLSQTEIDLVFKGFGENSIGSIKKINIG